MNTRNWLFFAPALFLLGAFGRGAQAQSTIEFWHAMEGPKAPLMDEMARELMKEHPAIKVNVSLQGGYTEMVRKIQAGIMANALPDVAMLGQRHGIPNISDSGKLMALDAILTAEDRKDISPQLFNRYTYK